MQNIIPIKTDSTFEASDDIPLPTGTRVADYEITGVIGEGGFGIVYLAFDHLLQRTVAIKEYMPATLAKRGKDNGVAVRLQRDRKAFETGLKSFINEARILAQFDHPALIKVYRFWEENNTAYMAMRYYEGQTLKNVIRDNPALVTQAWLKAMLKPILEALDTLYQVRILHRDISPDNILIQNNGEAVLLDFGAARQILGNMSQAMTVILKPGYAPIEQYADDATMGQGPWTDIYSLSAVVYFAIAKRPPSTSVARMVKDPIESLQNGEHNGFDREFLSAIDKGLAVKPEDRPQSIEEFRTLLQLELAGPVPFRHAGAASPVSPVSPAGTAGSRLHEPGFPPSLDKPKADLAAKGRPANSVGTFARYRAWWMAAALCVFGAAVFASLRPKTAPPVAPAGRTEAAAPPERVLPSRPAVTMQADVPPKLSINEAGRRAPLKSSPAQATGTVKLNIKPWGNIYVDGIAKGASPPLKKLVLSEGHHKIQIVNPNFPSHTIKIEISNKKASSIEYDFSGLKK